MEFSADTDEDFRSVKNEFAALNTIQADIASTRNRHWAIIQEQFDPFKQNCHILRDC